MMKPRLEWTQALSVGIEEIDAQHRELFQRAGKLLDGIHGGEPEELGALVDFLYQYAVAHFGTEEEAMRRARYPGYARHKAEHDRFISDLLTLARDHERSGAGAFMALKVSQWLTQWLRNHVSGTDAELGRFLVKRPA
ncbi:MAG TPA: bacteriohemerythrin [Anaeromyxobacter sp.]|nr:bacteriohemerythrin [Anaeromyxobacter sp.]